MTRDARAASVDAASMLEPSQLGQLAGSATQGAPGDAGRSDAGRSDGAGDAGAGARAGARGPINVVLITIDSLRADMPWAGYARPIAPNLTGREARSVSYTQAYALSSYTSMSVGGFLAGRVPSELARSGFFFGHYPDSVVMFPERLRSAGVRTLAAHAHFYFRPGGAGFEQGFDVYEIVPGITRNNLTDVDITGDRHEAIAERLLSDPANTGGRFFAWFHFMDPHDEYRPHEGITWGNRGRDRYDAEVTWTDRHLGRLFEFIARQPWAERTAIIVSADHGEAFGEHGRYRHGFELWNVLARVPWFFVVPGAPARRIAQSRSHIDLAPTVLDLLGVAPAADLPGRSLVPEIFGETPPEARDVWVDLPRTSDNDRRRALVHGRHKVIAYGDDSRFEVYDLVADPGEEHDLRTTDRATYDAMVARYRAATTAFREVHPYAARNLRGAPAGRGY